MLFRAGDVVHQLYQRQTRFEEIGEVGMRGQERLAVRGFAREQALQVLVGHGLDAALSELAGVGWGGWIMGVRVAHGTAFWEAR